MHFPDAEQIRLVQDNLSTHTLASLYAAFLAPEARLGGWKLGLTIVLLVGALGIEPRTL